MKIIDLLKSDKVTVSFEVFPPKSEANYESIYNAAMNVAALKPAYMSVTYGAGGSTSKSTLDIAGDIQKRYDVCTIAHLTCAGANKDDIHKSLDGMKTKGIENILALRGDRPKDYDGDPFAHYRYASELISEIKEYHKQGLYDNFDLYDIAYNTSKEEEINDYLNTKNYEYDDKDFDI